VTIERKTFDSADFKAVDTDQGVAEMIVSVFHNVDGGNEVVMPGFFAESIATRRTADGRPKAKGVWSHDWQSTVAKTLDAKELLPGDPLLPPTLADLGGLWVRGQFNLETQRGREAFSDLKFGSIDEFSIGYETTSDRFDPQTGIRYLLKGNWFEWSPVMVGMNDATALLSTKNRPYREQAEGVLADLSDLIERSYDIADLRGRDRGEKVGRVLSEANRQRLTALLEALAAAGTDIADLLAATEAPEKGLDLAVLYGEFMRTQARLNGVPV
jgi:HK97 family phage prohead protease